MSTQTKEKPVRYTTVKGTVSAFVEDGLQEIKEVGEEFREIYDNAPENLQQSDLNQRREATASEIEGLDEPSVESSILGDLDCTCQIDNGKLYRGRMSQSRACRASNGASKLRAAADAIREWLSENDDDPPDVDENDPDSLRERAAFIDKLADKGWDADDYIQAREEAETLADSLEEIADTVEGLEYPGMFG